MFDRTAAIAVWDGIIKGMPVPDENDVEGMQMFNVVKAFAIAQKDMHLRLIALTPDLE